MRILRLCITAHFVIFSLLLLNDGRAEMTKTPINSVNNKVVYFASFAGYNLPLKPVEELSKEEATSRNTYCVGFYDEAGSLYRFEKYLNGQLFFRHDYKYHDNGNLKENSGVDADGKARINRYDVYGRPIKDQ